MNTDNAPVTIVSCLYGTSHDKFVDEWAQSIRELETRPAEVIVATDRSVRQRGFHFPETLALICECEWKHPQAFYLQQAIMMARTEWVWILDIDDLALPDALDGIDTVDADVWQMGYIRSDGEIYLPPDRLTDDRNTFTGSSAIRRDIFEEVGGFRDVAFQDWDLWRRLAAIGAKVQTSGRPHFRYRLHDASRSATELVAARRAAHIGEMANVG